VATKIWVRDGGFAVFRLICFALAVAVLPATQAGAQSIQRVYSQFDSSQCRHFPGKAEEDYGSWRCPGYPGIDLHLSAGDQRMRVSFGRNAAHEPAAKQTFPSFNDVYKGTMEWRIETLPDHTLRPFATILRWNVKLESDERDTTGRVLVVTRLGPGGVCHVGYVDARANPDANALAAELADSRARAFQCGKDKPVVLGKTMPGLNMPNGD